MSTLTIRNLDDDLRARLRVRAAQNGRSMEAEVRDLLRTALSGKDELPLGSRIHARFSGRRGIDLDLPQRSERPRIPDLPR